MLHRERIVRPFPAWEHEKDRYEFDHAGLRCLILRHPELGHLNGYVGVTRKHPFYDKGYSECLLGCKGKLSDIPGLVPGALRSDYRSYDCTWGDKNHPTPESLLRVHGGITFSREGDGKEWPAEYYWFGFDCAHYQDYSSYLDAKLSELITDHRSMISDPGMSYKTVDYVWAEIESLAEQLARIQRYRLFLPLFYKLWPLWKDLMQQVWHCRRKIKRQLTLVELSLYIKLVALGIKIPTLGLESGKEANRKLYRILFRLVDQRENLCTEIA